MQNQIVLIINKYILQCHSLTLIPTLKLFRQGLISKPYFEYPEVDEDCEKSWRCECFIDSIKHYEGYFDYGVGEEDSKQEAKKAAACDMLCFFYDEDESDDDDWED